MEPRHRAESCTHFLLILAILALVVLLKSTVMTEGKEATFSMVRSVKITNLIVAEIQIFLFVKLDDEIHLLCAKRKCCAKHTIE